MTDPKVTNETTTDEAATNEEERVVDATMYAPTTTRVLTPEEAAHEVVNNPPASSVDQRHRVEPVEFPATIDRTVEGDAVTEVVNPDPEDQGFPIATSADEDYRQSLEDNSIDYTGVRDETEDGEELKK